MAMLVSLLAATAFALPAVTVAMRDGTQYVGDVVSKDDASLTLRTNTATMTIAWRNVTIETFKALHPDLYARLKAKAEKAAKVDEAERAKKRAEAQMKALPVEKTLRESGIVLRLIPAGTFIMGSPNSEKGTAVEEVSAEVPATARKLAKRWTQRELMTMMLAGETQHKVTLTKAFYIGKYEVTQGQWEKVMGINQAHFEKADDNPVEQVSWNACQEFIRKLATLEDLPEGSIRLPTEAEWEYACRAGTQTAFCYGDDLDSTLANINGNVPYGKGRKGKNRECTMPVVSFKPNAWGLYDMHGNVWEWCQDWYGPYATDDAVDPRGAKSGPLRVLRGGSWDYVRAGDCRSAGRGYSTPAYAGSYRGFRVSLPAGQ